MRGAVPAMWLGPGGYALLAALVLIAAALTPAIGWIAAVAITAGTFAALAANEVVRDRNALALERIVPRRLVLDRSATLEVCVHNRSARALHVGVVEAPVARVRVALDEVRATVAPHASMQLEIACLPYERGDTTFAATYAWFDAGLRIVRHRRRIDDAVARRVFPDVPAFDAEDDLALRARLTRDGARRLRRTGSGAEFAGFRRYVPGDAFRDIDWKATARSGSMMVAEHEIERSQQIGLAIDAGRLMATRVDGRRKLDIAISAALGIATLAQRAGDRVGAHVFAGTTLASVPPRAGARGPAAMLDALAAVEPRPEEPDYERAVLDLQRTYRKRSLIVVFTDLFDPIAAASLLGALAQLARRHVVVLALTNDGVLAGALAGDAPAEVTRRAVARRLSRERGAALGQLRARGMIVVDVAATALRPALLDAYVAIKQRGAI
jgi:uncharacterized protein (DUF58 family)